MSIPFYRAFEDRYRGSRELINERQQVYVPFLKLLKQLYPECSALDLGCGRGEWLEILIQNGFQAQGIDLDAGMLEACSALGLPVENIDALEKLKSLPDESLTVVSGFHIAEHIPFDDLKVLVAEALRVLKPAGLLILETPNSENLVVGTQTFYLDPTHNCPIPHLLLSFLAEYSQFSRTQLLRLQETQELAEGGHVDLFSVLHGVSPDYAIIAQKAGASEQLEIFDSVFGREYGLSLESLSRRYDAQVASWVDQSTAFNTELREQLAGLADQSTAATNDLREQLNQVQTAVRALEENDELENQVREAKLRADLADSRFHTVQLLQENTLDDVKRAEARLDEAFSVIEQLQIRLEHLTQHTLTQGQVEQAQAQAHAQAHLDDINAQLNASLGNAHHWWLRATAYEQQLTAIHRSTSWRITAPLRFAARVIYWPFRTSRSTFSQVLRRSVPHARLWLARRPLIERPVLAILKCNPWLHSKLSNMHQATLNPAPETVASDLQHGVIDHAPLTQRGRTIENALREAIMKGQK
ncbi:methyltransferase domain-containing protein [Pseudomonas syringae pv. syringae]|uniref:class I SAM-dependent methyltransferase n=1 Tax=Pseudomonas syringae TaxID=317 RepID=UPI000F008E14|nr:class I SAM-dependent methyltransferase [Pseudomonas syringae]MBC9742258.1 methyltransferase domain-containing protein [Pseudomonas syringae pv. syringae]MBC9746379.1 methyltransferase domain-containing protein [Pseudomonas syringae pv. syringae]MCK9721853.1 methyltransferase domain-containing protein [Pseudomonas syringae pv. syringae]RMS23720.1 WbbD [Pseudomonas syringae pv. aceris]